MASIIAKLVLLVVKRNTILKWRPIEEEEFDKEKSPELFRLGGLEDNKNDGWAVYTHFYAGIQNRIIYTAVKEVRKAYPGIDEKDIKSIVALGFRIINGLEYDCNYDVDKVVSRLTLDEQVELQKLDNGLILDNVAVSHEEEWYVMPYQETTSNYVTAVGKQTLVFLSSDNEDAKSCDLYTDTTPNVDRQKYDIMLDELATIYEHAVYSRNSKQAAGVRRKPMPMLERYYEMIGQLEKLIRQISLMPEVSLTDHEERLSASKIRRITARTLVDSMGGGAARLRAVTNRESFDIYEHRAIHSCLERICSIALCNERMGNEEGEDAEGVPDENAGIENALKEKLEETRSSLIERLNQNSVPAISGTTSPENQIWAKVSRDTLREARLVISQQKAYWTVTVSSAGDCFDWVDLSYGDNAKYINGVKYQTMYHNSIILKTSEELQELFLCFYLFKHAVSADCDVNVIIKGTGEKLSVATKPEDWDENKKWYPPQNTIEFNCLHSISIGGEIYEYVSFLSELNKTNEKSVLKEELIEFAQTLEIVKLKRTDAEILDYYRSLQRQKRLTTKNKWREIRCKAEKMLNANDFLNSGKKRESLHPSNIFLKGRYYKDVYMLLQDKKCFGFTGFDIRSKDTTLIRAAQNVYERWALYKMLWYFTEKLGFRFKNSNTLIKSLEHYFGGGPNSDKDASQYFHLSKEIGSKILELSLVYQANIYTQTAKTKLHELEREYQNKEKDNEYNKKRKEAENDHRTPDFVWIIGWENDEKKVFMLDTKYKDFGQQSKRAWINLLYDVAYEKYLCKITGGDMSVEDVTPITLGDNLCGSYILHSDTGTTDACFATEAGNTDKKASVSHYYGQNLEGLFKKLDGKRIKQMENWNKPPYTRFKEACRVGSVSMMPGQMDYFMNLFRMIMEHFFDLDREVCWNCGGTEIERLPSDGVGESYHCPKCHEFWVVTHCKNCYEKYNRKVVPIRKHKLNYYFETSDNKWIIYCPECGSNRVTSEPEANNDEALPFS